MPLLLPFSCSIKMDSFLHKAEAMARGAASQTIDKAANEAGLAPWGNDTAYGLPAQACSLRPTRMESWWLKMTPLHTMIWCGEFLPEVRFHMMFIQMQYYLDRHILM
jgi:hypothetical protein